MADPHELDAAVAGAARKVRILGSLTWPGEVEQAFLADYRAGRRVLPEAPVPEPPPAVDDVLATALAGLDRADPRQAFVARTAGAYRRAIAMLAAAGTPAFTHHSRALFGHPRDPIVPGGPTTRQEAEHLLEVAAALDSPPAEPTLAADEARDALQRLVDAHFDPPLPVELDPHLGSLAAAGSQRVRLRDGVRYAPVQIEQFLHHEALVHSATKRNGRDQTALVCLGLSSPRTMAVQEGLATLAELITDTLDLTRLRRIALRVQIVDMALEGADFLQVFEALLDAGQPEHDAFRSAMRVFRGGDVRGGVAFTKDVVYLGGLRRVHLFMLAALRARRAELPAILFAGRMTCGDAVALAPLVADGTLVPPRVLPPWVAHEDRLAAYLAWAAFGQRLDPVPLEAFTPR